MAQSPEEMAAKMIENLQEKTGKTLEEWLAVTKTCGLEKHGQIVKWLKSEQGMTHGFASLVAHQYRASLEGSQPPAVENLVDLQYAGPKAGLRPIYDALVAKLAAFGDDLELSPKKSYVSLRRKKQFALVQPSTKTRVDVGINLKGMAPEGRLEASGSFNQMVSHRVRLTEVGHVDDELMGWLQKAYELAK
ncbi:DUF4287 domain-containing protein [Sulfidibacter corallicola]|uniref:DUF4287 domain-containing protein n=1 Tax=Sulfidibacter corallicola TaxID=2818388 RepID=A0A8A4TR33_SULCO|nr:DUF4287 domain-containing protein [Sulfidibacter corallicola]QTD51983.1 DUF4287 domain-containing protein [Sulfidibacter corallicola]